MSPKRSSAAANQALKPSMGTEEAFKSQKQSKQIVTRRSARLEAKLQRFNPDTGDKGGAIHKSSDITQNPNQRRSARIAGRPNNPASSTQALIRKPQPKRVEANNSQRRTQLAKTKSAQPRESTEQEVKHQKQTLQETGAPAGNSDLALVNASLCSPGRTGRIHPRRKGKATSTDHKNLGEAPDNQDTRQAAKVPAWLEAIEEQESPQQSEASAPSQPSSDASDMPVRPITPSVHESKSNEKDTNTTKTCKNNAVFQLKLEHRNADPDEETPGDPEGDLLMEHFEQPYRLKIGYEHVKSYIDDVEDFLRKCMAAKNQDVDLYETIETFRNDMNKWLPQVRMFTLTNMDFKKDLDYCKRKNANEALVQRTVMPATLDRWRLKAVFEYTFESQWSKLNRHRVPSSAGPTDIISAPKPDFNLSFNFNAIRNGLPKSASASDTLRFCIFPDNDITRCFPFFFVEAKKSEDSLDEARLHNMNSAMQALHNLFVCMKQAGCLFDFFDTVRVFSISFNAHKYEARIYRAMVDYDTNALTFAFQTLREEYNYGQDSLGGLINIILTKYAEPKLLELLRKTYRTLTEQSKKDPESSLWIADAHFSLPAGFNPSRMYKGFRQANRLHTVNEDEEEDGQRDSDTEQDMEEVEQLGPENGLNRAPMAVTSTDNASGPAKRSRKQAGQAKLKKSKQLHKAGDSFGASGLNLAEKS